MTKFLLLLPLCCLVAAPLFSQSDFYRSNHFAISDDGQPLEYAWAGGINSAQVSTIDLDSDGLDDLFIFDRTSGTFTTYLNTGSDYVLTFDYQDQFPPVRDWVLLRDFNCDGRKDVFTYHPGGIRVWENIGTGSSLDWTLEVGLLKSYYDIGTPFFSNLFVSSVDIPAIDDVDGDGDLDVLTFDIDGSVIQFHRNLALENGHCDSLQMELRNFCYGSIGEDSNAPTLYLGEDFNELGFCPFNFDDAERIPRDYTPAESLNRHAGSSLCIFDDDGNGTKDILLGDISARSMSLVSLHEFAGTADSALSVQEDFPADDVSINLPIFQAAFFEDVDHDGIRDLVVSPANALECEDDNSVLFYKNEGSNDNTDFAFQEDDFVQGQMLDFGTSTRPVLHDVDDDGLLDLIVGGRGRYQETGAYTPLLYLYMNVGSAESPSFSLTDTDLGGAEQIDYGSFLMPSFGDLDADGDKDMILGTGTGDLLYLENSASAGEVPVFDQTPIEMSLNNGSPLDLGAQTSPLLWDLDEDGLLDLIIGERNGNLNFVRNVGTADTPEWELENTLLGGITTDDDGNTIGYSVPTIYTADGQLRLLIGNDKGTLYLVEGLEDIEGLWTITDSTAFDIDAGRLSAPTVGDLDNDGEVDMIIGKISGGLELYTGAPFVGLSERPEMLALKLYPNPADGEVMIEVDAKTESLTYEVIDIGGRVVLRGQGRRFDSSQLRQGVYQVVVSSPSGVGIQQLMKY